MLHISVISGSIWLECKYYNGGITVNNIELNKLIAQYVQLQHKLPKEIKGYENRVVRERVNDMISKKVIYEGEIKKAPWERDSENQSKQYRRMAYYVDKELLKAELVKTE